jgi:uncharacterized protein (TIGR00159 family)
MIMGVFSFLHFTVADVLDILMVGLLIFLLIRSIRGNSTVVNIVIVLVVLLIAQQVAGALQMRMMSVLLNTLLDVGVLAIIILFQPEIRHLMNRVANQAGISRKAAELFNRLLGIKENKMSSKSVEELAAAVRTMSDDKTGALIVIRHGSDLDEYIRTGDSFDAEINRRLVMNIFFKNSPLHDGAMIINGNRICAARCQLPMTSRTDLPARYGMRHRAAVGLSEETDADVIVCSEETGKVAFVRGGKVTPVPDMTTLITLLEDAMGGAPKNARAQREPRAPKDAKAPKDAPQNKEGRE